ncbi:MAG TPA: PilZ domain-containing protein [Polyangia bacterium]|nr:PilZ domain-containing protein [Polyangia bacterium]
MGRRAEPRVGFRRDVRVSWPGEMNGVVARAVNLSPTGILVDAPTPTACPVGSSVLCDVALPLGALRLRGRVAHRRVLSPAKVGMGITFVDLSPWVAAELGKVIDESEEKTQPVTLRFAGTSEILCTRAVPTPDGFQFVTALPFLRPETEVDITSSPDGGVGTKGWVSAVTLAGGPDDIPHLVIDIRAAEGAPSPAPLDAPTAPADVTAVARSTTFARPSADVPGPWDPDRTQNVRIRDLSPRRTRARASTLAMLALALAGVTAAIALRPTSSPRAAHPSPTPGAPASAAAGPAATPAPTIEPILPAPPAPPAEPASFEVGLVGSLAGAERYLLRDPDGVAFNLPKARATMAVGTYNPPVRGLRAVWVRALPGGGTHLRFYYTKSRPSPEVLLQSDGVTVQGRASPPG